MISAIQLFKLRHVRLLKAVRGPSRLRILRGVCYFESKFRYTRVRNPWYKHCFEFWSASKLV